MTTDKSTRGVPVTIELADAASEKAWEKKTTISDLIRDAIDTLLADTSQLAVWGTDPGNGPRRLTFIIPDEQWEDVKAVAWANRKSIAATVRIAVRHAING